MAVAIALVMLMLSGEMVHIEAYIFKFKLAPYLGGSTILDQSIHLNCNYIIDHIRNGSSYIKCANRFWPCIPSLTPYSAASRYYRT